MAPTILDFDWSEREKNQRQQTAIIAYDNCDHMNDFLLHVYSQSNQDCVCVFIYNWIIEYQYKHERSIQSFKTIFEHDVCYNTTIIIEKIPKKFKIIPSLVYGTLQLSLRRYNNIISVCCYIVHFIHIECITV